MVYSCMKLILNIEPLEEDTYEGLWSEGKVLIPDLGQLVLALEKMMNIFSLAPSLTVAVSCCIHLKNRWVQSNVSCQLGCCLVHQLFCSLSQNHCKNKAYVYHIKDLAVISYSYHFVSYLYRCFMFSLSFLRKVLG
jgi:hypothetical protein